MLRCSLPSNAEKCRDIVAKGSAARRPDERAILDSSMRKGFLLAILSLIVGLWMPPTVRAQEGGPVVRGYLFYSSTCPECQDARARVVPGFYRSWGQRLQLLAVDISEDSANLQWLQACGSKFGVPIAELEVPALFVGTDYLIGTVAIETQFPALFDRYESKGGVAFPEIPRPGRPLPVVARFMFFYSPTCPHCRYVEENVLPKIRDKYGAQVQWEALDVTVEANLRALLALGKAAQLPDNQVGSVPVVFVGDEY